MARLAKARRMALHFQPPSMPAGASRLVRSRTRALLPPPAPSCRASARSRRPAPTPGAIVAPRGGLDSVPMALNTHGRGTTRRLQRPPVHELPPPCPPRPPADDPVRQNLPASESHEGSHGQRWSRGHTITARGGDGTKGAPTCGRATEPGRRLPRRALRQSGLSRETDSFRVGLTPGAPAELPAPLSHRPRSAAAPSGAVGSHHPRPDRAHPPLRGGGLREHRGARRRKPSTAVATASLLRVGPAAGAQGADHTAATPHPHRTHTLPSAPRPAPVTMRDRGDRVDRPTASFARALRQQRLARRADPGGAGRAGGAEPARGQRPGAGRQAGPPPGDPAPAGRGPRAGPRGAGRPGRRAPAGPPPRRGWLRAGAARPAGAPDQLRRPGAGAGRGAGAAAATRTCAC